MPRYGALANLREVAKAIIATEGNGDTPQRKFIVSTISDKPESAPARLKPTKIKAPDIVSTSVPQTLAMLHVNSDTGLTAAGVETSRKEYGYNEVAVTKEHAVLNFLKKFLGISAWMLELM